MNLTVLPPCAQSLKIHYNKYSRANHVSRMSRYASPKLGHLSSTLHGWNEYLSLKWVEEAYPDNIADDEEIPEFEINDIDYDNNIDAELEETFSRMDVNKILGCYQLSNSILNETNRPNSFPMGGG